MKQSNKIGSNLLWTHKNVAFIWDFFNKVLNFFSRRNDRWRSVVSSYILRTLDSGINIGVRLLIFFQRLRSLLERVMYIFFKISSIWWYGWCLFQGLRLMFLPNVPGTTFIPGAMSIPVRNSITFIWLFVEFAKN